jgi:hypothetical protein
MTGRKTMQSQVTFARRIASGACLAVLAAALLVGSAAQGGSDSCREWRREHCAWKAESMRRYLLGAPQRELDAAIFEMLQREAYLTSCDISVQGSRGVLVGWRLVGRSPDEYGSAVLEAVLERAGFDVGLREQLGDAVIQPAADVNTTTAAAPPPQRFRDGLASVAR